MTLAIAVYLGGVLTILSPCILPILPFVFARTDKPFLTSTMPMLAGMASAFSAVATLAAVGGNWAIEANQFGRIAALLLLGIFGASLISPRLAAFLGRPASFLGSRILMRSSGSGSVSGSFSIGIATGFLWAPCAGPILGLILTGAALNGATLQTSLLLLAYAAGAATSLALATFAGGRMLPLLKSSMPGNGRVRQFVGASVLAGIAVIGLGLDTSLLAKISYAGTTSLETRVLSQLRGMPPETPALDIADRGTEFSGEAPRRFQSDLPVISRAPPLDGAVEWLNSQPLDMQGLRGKVILIDFWTYSCINCIRTMPYVRTWADKYRDDGLVVIGVHAPEFAFEKKIENVRRAVDGFKITYPVAIDNNYKIWRAFANSYWPAHYLIDADGNIRYTHFGEGNYEETEQAIQDLLREAGHGSQPKARTSIHARGAESPPDLANIRSGETYIGYQRATGFSSNERLHANVSAHYTVGDIGLNQWGLSGNWTMAAEQAKLDQRDGTITYRFSARDLHLVLGPGSDGKPIRFQVTINGEPPGTDHGSDTDANGNGIINATRLYQLVRQTGDIDTKLFEIRFLDPGVEAYAFTFG